MKIFFVFLLATAVLPFLTACSMPQKAYWDAEVDRLCAIDGGIRVYETVTLPPDKFDERGQINFYRPTQGENRLGPKYIYHWDTHYYKKGDPSRQGAQEISMKKDHIKIVRRSDMKLLGEFILYRRAGGDLPGPWVPSAYRCPGSEVHEILLMNKIFVKSTEENKK